MKAGLSSLAFIILCCLSKITLAESTPGDAGGVLTEETRIYLGPCFFTAGDSQPIEQPQPAQNVGPWTSMSLGTAFSLPAVLGGAAAEAVLDFSIGALKAAGEDQSVQAIAAYPANGWMYQLNANAKLIVNPNSQCVQIISGSFWNGLRMFQEDQSPTETPVRVDAKTVPLDDRKLETLKDDDKEIARIAAWKSDKKVEDVLKQRYRQLKGVRLFFETRIERFVGADDKFVLAPNALLFKEPIEGSFFDCFKGKKRNILVTVTLSTAGSELGKSFASVNFPFREVPSNTLLTPLYFKKHTSRAIQAPVLTDDEKKSLQAQIDLLKKASSEVNLVNGVKPPEQYTPQNSLKDPNYIAAAKTYCAAVDAFNTKAKGNKAQAATAPECPVDLQVAKLDLTEAREQFDKEEAKSQATYNTANIWLKGTKSAGVSCSPSGIDNDFKSNCTLNSPTDARPITVNASVVEVREGSKFAAFLGKVLEKTQPDINKAIESYSPEKKAEADEQSKQNLEAYQIAVADVSTAEATLAETEAKAGSTDTQKAQARHDLLNKKIVANQAARKAGVSEPYQIP